MTDALNFHQFQLLFGSYCDLERSLIEVAMGRCVESKDLADFSVRHGRSDAIWQFGRLDRLLQRRRVMSSLLLLRGNLFDVNF